MEGERESRCRFTEKEEPKLRHEFVGMMFAVAIGEVGLQVATLVQQKEHWTHFLPAYTHLALVAVIIAASWVGWTLSPSPGARQDVTQVLEFEFPVLLIDVALVICYFVLARLVDLQHPEGSKDFLLVPSAAPEAWWIFVIFCLYLLWDVWTKIVIYTVRRRFKNKDDGCWWPNYAVRFLPTLLCLGLSYCAYLELSGKLSAAQVTIADVVLLSIVLLFRAGKDVASAFWPSDGKSNRMKKILSVGATVLFVIVFSVMMRWTLHGDIRWIDRFIQ